MDFKQFLFRSIVFILAFCLADFFISSILLNGLIKYYGFNNQPEILINGSSMSYYGINKKLIEKAINRHISTYVRGGVGTEDRYFMIQHFLSEYSSNLDTVIYEMNPTIFQKASTSKNVHLLFLPFFDSKSLRPYFKQRMTLKSRVTYKLIRSLRFDDQLKINSFRGYFRKYGNWQDGNIDTTKIDKLKENKGSISIEMDNNQIEIFQRTIRQLNNQGVTVLLLMMPIYSVKKETYQPESYNHFCSFIKYFCSTSPRTYFIDLNTIDSLTEYHNFFDPIHLNTNGQNEVSRVIVDILKYKLTTVNCQPNIY
jgi:hypothetical protein